MNTQTPIYALQCSLSPNHEYHVADAGHDLDLLIKRAEGFVQVLYGFVTEPQVSEGCHYGYPHYPEFGGEKYAAVIHRIGDDYEQMMVMALQCVERKERQAQS
jgi:hypothetical protein